MLSGSVGAAAHGDADRGAARGGGGALGGGERRGGHARGRVAIGRVGTGLIVNPGGRNPWAFARGALLPPLGHEHSVEVVFSPCAPGDAAAGFAAALQAAVAWCVLADGNPRCADSMGATPRALAPASAAALASLAAAGSASGAARGEMSAREQRGAFT